MTTESNKNEDIKTDVKKSEIKRREIKRREIRSIDKKRSSFPLFFILFVIGLSIYFSYGTIKKFLPQGKNEETENAQLETNIVPILPKVDGWVKAVLVNDNQDVKAGDTLVIIDDRDLKISVLQAETALKSAQANVSFINSNVGTVNANLNTSEAAFQAQNSGIAIAEAAVATATANVEIAKIHGRKATQDYVRAEKLMNEKSGTKAAFDAAAAEKEAADAAIIVAEKQVVSAQAQIEAARRQTNVGSSQKAAAQTQVTSAQQQVNVAQTQVEQRKAELELAKLKRNFAVVTAPIPGKVSRKNVQVSQLVNVGQPLMTIVDDTNVWVVANFKETQVSKMEVGQKVKILVDAYEKKEISGTIQSFSGATGAKFSASPPDNATGDFKKVTQCIPTKIIISDKSSDDMPLRAGMSVRVVVPLK